MALPAHPGWHRFRASCRLAPEIDPPLLTAHRIALACITPLPDADELGPLRLPSYGVRRVQAAVVSDPNNPGHVVKLFDFGVADVAAYVEAILDFEPDILGFSIYVWSTPPLVAVAHEVKRRRPDCLVVFGGPSARQALFELEPYRQADDYLDAIVEGDGEYPFREIASLPHLTRSAVAAVPGVTTRVNSRWTRNPARSMGLDLDPIVSPYQLGLMAQNDVAYLETFRGCPLSCRFCEWGDSAISKAVFSADYIAREMEAFRGLEAPALFLLDAGLNLNLRGFRNLREANRRTGFLKRSLFWAEIYPSVIRDEHMDFLQEIGAAYLGVGMQSMDKRVLELHQRPADSPRFERAVLDLASVTSIELQIIMGLPGDTPEGFRRTLEYALSFPAGVRVYHCLVLPDALMTRGLPEWDMRFNPMDLSMISCFGWSEDAIASMRAELDQRTRRSRGKIGRYWWSFPPQSESGR